MSAIRTAIFAYFKSVDTAPLWVDLAGARLYYDEAPEQPTSPYCVFHIFDEIPMETFDLEFEEALIQFSYYGATANICDDGIADIKAMYDYAILTISGYTCLRMEREAVFHPSKLQPEDVWSGSVRYSLLVKKD